MELKNFAQNLSVIVVGGRMLLRVAAQRPAAARKIQAISESLRRRLRLSLRQCGRFIPQALYGTVVPVP